MARCCVGMCWHRTRSMPTTRPSPCSHLEMAKPRQAGSGSMSGTTATPDCVRPSGMVCLLVQSPGPASAILSGQVQRRAAGARLCRLQRSLCGRTHQGRWMHGRCAPQDSRPACAAGVGNDDRSLAPDRRTVSRRASAMHPTLPSQSDSTKAINYLLTSGRRRRITTRRARLRWTITLRRTRCEGAAWDAIASCLWALIAVASELLPCTCLSVVPS